MMDMGMASRCCSGTDVAMTCTCVAPGDPPMGLPSNCCSGVLDTNGDGHCGCIGTGLDDKGSPTNCCRAPPSGSHTCG
jgi:hypothetical protein